MPTTMKKRHKIDEETLTLALDRHTEALFKRRAGSDASPYREDPDSAALFSVNRQLFETLAPVEPSDAFVDSLKARLMEQHTTQTQLKAGKAVQKRKIVRTAVSVYAVATIAARIIGSIILVAAFIRTRRRRATAAA